MLRTAKRLALLGLVSATVLLGIAAPAGASTGVSSRPAGVTGSGGDFVAAAGTVGFSVTNGRCYSNAITFTAQTYETGLSGVQRFRQKATLQEYTRSGWVNRASQTYRSQKFANTAGATYYTLNWTENHVANGASWRVVWQGFYLNGSGQTIAKTNKVRVNCL
jgi:hypothetical protein